MAHYHILRRGCPWQFTEGGQHQEASSFLLVIRRIRPQAFVQRTCLVFRRRSSINVGRVYFWWHVLCVSALAEVIFFGFSKTSMIALPLLGQFRFQTTQPTHVPAQRPPEAASLPAYSLHKLPPDPLAITGRPSHTRGVSCFLIDSGQCGISKPLASRCPCEMGHRLLYLLSWGACSPTNRHSNRSGLRRLPQALISINMSSHQGP